MDAGAIELFPKFADGSTSTTVETMKEYVKAGADKFCELTGLSIISTIDNTYGCYYIIGKEGETQGLVYIGNVNSSTYFYKNIIVGILGAGNSIQSPAGSNSATNHGSYCMTCNINTNSCWIKYIKSANCFVFGLKHSTGAMPSSFDSDFIITTVKNGSVERKMSMYAYSGGIATSYVSILNEDARSIKISTSMTDIPIIPKQKEIITGVYLSNGSSMPMLKLFTNNVNVQSWSGISVNGKDYVVGPKNTWTVLIEVTNESA